MSGKNKNALTIKKPRLVLVPSKPTGPQGEAPGQGRDALFGRQYGSLEELFDVVIDRTWSDPHGWAHCYKDAFLRHAVKAIEVGSPTYTATVNEVAQMTHGWGEGHKPRRPKTFANHTAHLLRLGLLLQRETDVPGVYEWTIPVTLVERAKEAS